MTDRVIKVEVDIKDKRKFQDIVLLVDRKDFLQDLNIYLEHCAQEINEDRSITNQYMRPVLHDEALRLVRKYRYPDGFSSAISAIALKGIVTDSDLRHCYLAKLISPSSYVDSYSNTFTKEDLVIFIDPSIITWRKKAILDQVKGFLLDAEVNISKFPRNHPLCRDIKREIKCMRKLYLDRELNNLSTKKMSQIYEREEKTIDTYIDRYRNSLKYDI
ncbi:MAG: hypothetical protein GW947_02220 [Candidatus Pacebacteria bacterium]|nr:hypothetical protein [Candidatus Paceibacterota bacterium]